MNEHITHACNLSPGDCRVGPQPGQERPHNWGPGPGTANLQRPVATATLHWGCGPSRRRRCQGLGLVGVGLPRAPVAFVCRGWSREQSAGCRELSLPRLRELEVSIHPSVEGSLRPSPVVARAGFARIALLLRLIRDGVDDLGSLWRCVGGFAPVFACVGAGPRRCQGPVREAGHVRGDRTGHDDLPLSQLRLLHPVGRTHRRCGISHQ